MTYVSPDDIEGEASRFRIFKGGSYLGRAPDQRF
jgi:hypothetical protein